jgi:predicted nucleic acid-binding protein
MTDATSFALMKERDLKIAYTFDHHFEIAGFQPFRD